ncbi:hypothetical protein EYC08_18480 [Tabrizicola sp. WMC-M-20]|nr:hypothetical protein EYC08_18480 [Tabrizicola sp. WMC-M-20]
MSTCNLFAISAFGVVLALAPGAVVAQPAQPANAEITLFVPLVDACVSLPTEETCQQVRAVVTECALEFDEERCGLLVSEPDMVFKDPAQRETAQVTLTAAAEAIAGMKFADVEQSVLAESSRADAERTLLRGDKNLMAHSAPPVLDGEETAAEATEGSATQSTPDAD